MSNPNPRWIWFKNQRMNLKDAAKALGVTPSTVIYYVRTRNLTHQEAFEFVVGKVADGTLGTYLRNQSGARKSAALETRRRRELVDRTRPAWRCPPGGVSRHLRPGLTTQPKSSEGQSRSLTMTALGHLSPKPGTFCQTTCSALG